MQRPDHFLVVEPEDERREILLAELREARSAFRSAAVAFADCAQASGAVAVALPE